MRVAFLCGGLSEGGVADYVRLLAGAVKERGVEPFVIALADRSVRSPQINSGSHGSLALPAGLPWLERVGAVRAALDAFAPDWVALQFVPFIFNRKGVVAGAAAGLERLAAGFPLEVMVHELWVAPLPGRVPLRQQLLRALQRPFIVRLLRRLHPAVLHTSNAVYLDLLRRAGFAPRLLPLFGNVPVVAPSDRRWLDQALAEAGVDRGDRPLLFGFFGGIAPDWDGDRLLVRLAASSARLGRPAAVLSAGAAGPIEPRLEDWRRRHPTLRFHALGVQPAERISAYLQALDCGLTSYPYALIGKSGSVTAMLEHGLPVVVAWGDLRPDLPALAPQWADLVLPPAGDLDRFLASLGPRRPGGSQLLQTADCLLADLRAPRGMMRTGLVG